MSDIEPTAGSYTIPVATGSGKSLGTGGSLTYKQIKNDHGTESDFANIQRYVGALFHPRAISMAAWPMYSSDDLTDKEFGNAQTSIFSDPLLGFPCD